MESTATCASQRRLYVNGYKPWFDLQKDGLRASLLTQNTLHVNKYLSGFQLHIGGGNWSSAQLHRGTTTTADPRIDDDVDEC